MGKKTKKKYKNYTKTEYNTVSMYDDKPHYDKYAKPVPVTENHKKYHNLLKNENKKIIVCNG